ncbi:MAG: competence/damage-inducible protein A, partial [Rhodothermales bacterium]|nr:competence/damage-inducible protein A [Rhodothermales bacterium]
MRAIILTVGDELLIGQVIDSNAAWIGEQLAAVGVDVHRMITVSDEESEIRRFVRESLQDASILICTGGLGPTHDDITKEAVAAEFGVGLERREDIIERLRERFSARGRDLPNSAYRQADVPEGFHAEPNRRGTAPALIRQWEGDESPRLLALLPGVPHEMKEFMRSAVMPRIEDMLQDGVVRRKTILSAGLVESELKDRLEGVEDRLSGQLSLAFLPNVSGVRMRITAHAESDDEAVKHISELESWIRERIGTYVFGEGTDTLESVVGRLLTERGRTLAVAESCTGGLIGSLITDVPGSSAYFRGGVVSYSNQAKWNVISVDRDTLERHGAVSSETAEQMARGVRTLLDADIGLATTGIMGPGGGSDDKPVGTLWMGIANADGTASEHVRLGNERETNKQRAAAAA